MNLFENLQMMKESDTSIVSEFKEFLSSKNAQYIANEIGETKDGMQIVIYDGDWKHEHLYMKRLLDEFFTNKGININIVSEEIGESGQDTYSARYDVEFNPEPKEYLADETPLKFATEAKLPKPPKFWDSMFRVNVIKAYNNGELTLDNIEEWETNYNGGIKPNPSLGTEEILNYYINHKDELKESNNSDWKRRFKNMDIYVSDKYPNYQIKKSYTSSKQEVWQVLDFRTQREVFASGTFEGAVKWVEDKKIVKESNDIDLDDYEYVGYGSGPNRLWQLYRRFDKELNKGVWVAKHQNTGEIRSITYDQAQGFEPIENSGITKLSRDLGRMLLPKRESNDEDYDDNAATFLDTLEKEVKEAAHKFMLSVGFPEDEADDYLSVSTDINDDYVMVAVGAELGYDSLFNLCQTLDKVIAKHDEDAYFEPECPGRIVAYLFGEKAKNVHKEKEQALKNKINSIDKMEESNHNKILDKDYATGEKLYNDLKEYLISLDQVSMDGEDCNWEPSEFNAKNLNADGEIYLECGAYILIYPYINEWAEDYFKVIVMDTETCELNVQLKNGIEKIFNKFKTDKWKLVFEG